MDARNNESELERLLSELARLTPGEYTEPTNNPSEDTDTRIVGEASERVKGLYTIALRHAKAHDSKQAEAADIYKKNTDSLVGCATREAFENAVRKPVFVKRDRRARDLIGESAKDFLLFQICMYLIWIECKSEFGDALPGMYQGPLLFTEWRVGWVPSGNISPIVYVWREPVQNTSDEKVPCPRTGSLH